MEAALPISITSIVIAGGSAVYLNNTIKNLSGRVDKLEEMLAVTISELKKKDEEIAILKSKAKDNIGEEAYLKVYPKTSMHERSTENQHIETPMVPPAEVTRTTPVSEGAVLKSISSEEESREYLARARKRAASARPRLG